MLSVSAPGKLYLFGEYGVLAGGWSLVAAVGRRVTACRKERATGYQVRGAGFGETTLVEAVLEELGGRAGADSPAYFETNVEEFYRGGRKLGLGSSAASTVALTAVALLEDRKDGERAEGRAALSDETLDEIFETAEAAHRRFQGGRGSGGGLAAATYGGCLGYRVRQPLDPFAGLLGIAESAEQRPVGPSVVEPVGLPDELELRAVWLGEPASTTSFITRVERQLAREPESVYRSLQAIAEVARRAIDISAVGPDGRSGPVEAFIECVRRGDRAMDELGERIGAPVVIDRHRQLRGVAEAVGAAAKPSGAGGGDYSIVAGDAQTDWSKLEAELPEGAELFGLEFGVPGLDLG